jgi:predicted enzyme related to lactoylglutathione lyase
MQKNTVSHFEIYANDPEKLSHFYTTLFDWQIEKTKAADGQEYRIVRTVDVDDHRMPKAAGAINGGIVKRPNGYEVNGAVNYVMVDSIEGFVEKANTRRQGDQGQNGCAGWVVRVFVDPEGNNFAVFKADPQARTSAQLPKSSIAGFLSCAS